MFRHHTGFVKGRKRHPDVQDHRARVWDESDIAVESGNILVIRNF